MRAPLSVDEYDLAGLFGCLPKQQDSDVPWQYNDSAYEVADSVLHLSFAIAPAYRDVRLLITVGSILKRDGNRLKCVSLQRTQSGSR